MTDEQYDPIAAKLHSTTDAQVWAQEFLKVVTQNKHGNEDDQIVIVNEGLMISWFANAIEVGRNAGYIDARAGY